VKEASTGTLATTSKKERVDHVKISEILQ